MPVLSELGRSRVLRSHLGRHTEVFVVEDGVRHRVPPLAAALDVLADVALLGERTFQRPGGNNPQARGPRSSWSQANVGMARGLIAAARMRPRGLAEIEAAPADGP